MNEHYHDEIICLAHALGELRDHRFHSALNYAIPVLELLDRQLLECVKYSRHVHPTYRRVNMPTAGGMSVLIPNGFIKTSLSEVVSLGWNKRFGDDSDFRTCLGAMVRNGKQYGPHDSPPDPLSIRGLTALVILVEQYSLPDRHTDLVISMPSSKGSVNGLPSSVAKTVAEVMNWEIGGVGALIRDASIPQMKNIEKYDAKLASIKNTMKADASIFQQKRVLIIDDLLDSGASLREAARAIRTAGAIDVRAITLEKSRHFTRETFRKYDDAGSN